MSDETERYLRGSCSCGRNQYIISLPDDPVEDAEVFFDNSSDNRRTQAAPLTAWLRVPLIWYQSHTRSYFPDETHSSIRRTFTPPHAPYSKRNFCGYCGTQLTYWTEQPSDEADYLSVTVGSIFGEDQRILEDLDLLPMGSPSEDLLPVHQPATVTSPPSNLAPSAATQLQPLGHNTHFSRSFREGTSSGIPWFEEMIQGSQLGRVGKSRRGMGVSNDGSTKIEWEVSEWHDDGTGGSPDFESESGPAGATGKRKIEEVGEGRL
ncbi:hypothetical protein FQN54_001195 [Arachnomyces sp. PD_36]|nr:hypothetical protein FQN54_001195 [Arachnomyces sp. PD_36]